jgi:hypothetical protein
MSDEKQEPAPSPASSKDLEEEEMMHAESKEESLEMMEAKQEENEPEMSEERPKEKTKKTLLEFWKSFMQYDEPA